jgi:sugar phosphate isomerase/epimerase
MVYLELSPARAVERLAGLGVRVVELSYDNFLRGGVRELQELEAVAEVVSTSSLASFSVHLPYDSLDPSPSGVRSAIRRFSRWARVLDSVEVSHYVVHLPNLPPSPRSAEVAAAYLVGVAEAVGPTPVAVENPSSPTSFGARAAELAEALSRVGLGGVYACLDVGHANIVREPLRRFSEVLGSRVRVVHVHDNDGLRDLHLPPGAGTVDLGELAVVVEAVRPEKLIAEVACSGLERCDVELRRSLAVLESLVGGVRAF